MNSPGRTGIASLALSAAALVGIALSEGYSPVAYTPVPGDVPTIGYGSTEGVRLGQSITPDRALVRLLADASKFEQAVKRCAPVPMYSYEFSAYVSLAYNVGEGRFCNSSIPIKLKAGDYEAACKTIPEFNKVRDCTKPKVFNPKTGKLECPLVEIRGLTNRRQDEYKLCMGES
jgi:lysozyme